MIFRAENLYNAVRDMFDMFRSVVPVYHKHNFATVPQLALLFHNDCLYLAHQLLTLAHSYKSRYLLSHTQFHNDHLSLRNTDKKYFILLAHSFDMLCGIRLPEPLNQRATFVDMVPLFRSLGIEYFHSQMVCIFSMIQFSGSTFLFIMNLSSFVLRKNKKNWSEKVCDQREVSQTHKKNDVTLKWN